MTATPAAAKGLDNNSPADIWYNWDLMANEPAPKKILMENPATGQDTYYFRTRDDVWGVLEVIGVTDNPRGVKIRYKLVQHGNPADEDMAQISNGRPSGTNTAAPAIKAVHDWLALMDAGAFPESWEAAADNFHEAVTKDAWVSVAESVRRPLGQVISRKEISGQPTSNLPGMPQGLYFIVQFQTAFTAATDAVETVTFTQEKDGQWRASAYLIRPRTAEQTAAVTAAQKWLDGIDSGRYAESWTDAAEIFRNAVTQEKWVSSLQSVRAPLGKLEIRTMDSAETLTQMPGGPDGKYVVMQFQTAFASLNPATETVTFVLEKDGRWKASGYYIK